MINEAGPPPRTAVFITSIAFSLANFRGPLLRDFVARGFAVKALAPDYDDKTRAAVLALGVEPIDIELDRTGLRPLHDLRAAIALWRLLRELKPDLVFNYFIKPVIYGGLAAWMAGVPSRFALVAGLGYIFTPDGERDPLKRKLLRFVARQLYRLGFAASQRVFLQNADDLAYFTERRILPSRKAVLLNGTGVDLNELRVSAIPAGPPVFLLMARLLREKGIAEYVEAARILRRDTIGVRFVLLGGLDPNPGGFTLCDVEAWTRDGLIEWLGHVDDVRPHLARASVFVLPSYREGKPRSTQEAMAMGRPIVTTDAPGCRDTVIDGVNGFLVPPRDAGALTVAMRRFIDDPALIAPMGLQSRRLAEERFDVRAINAIMLSVMNVDAVEGSGPWP